MGRTAELDLRLFPKGYFDKYAPEGSKVQQVEIEETGTIVGYGIPNPEHNCDAMGCPTIGHVLFILPGRGKKE